MKKWIAAIAVAAVRLMGVGALLLVPGTLYGEAVGLKNLR